jgi:hypothetical protein
MRTRSARLLAFAAVMPLVMHTPVFAGAGFMAVRDVLVAGFGLKTARQLKAPDAHDKSGRVGIFRIYSTSKSEIVLGQDDKHLDFRLSVLCNGHHLIVSTVVHCHNRLGRLYIRLIAPFHRWIVQASLRNAACAGWPLATSI